METMQIAGSSEDVLYLICFVPANNDWVLLSSSNRGQDWSKLTGGFDFGTIYYLSPFLWKDPLIILGTTLGVLYSSDGGNTWNLTQIKHEVHDLAMDANGRIFAATGGNNAGLWYADDVASTWTSIVVPQGTPPYTGAPPYTVSVLYSSRLIYSARDTIYASSDAGESWDKIFEVDNKIDQNILEVISEKRGALFVSVADGFTVDGNKLYRSLNGGADWNLVFDNLLIPVGLTITSDGRLIATKNGQKVVVSDDLGTTWNDLLSANDLGTSVNSIRSVHGDPNGYVLLGTNVGVYRLMPQIPVEISSFFVE